MKTHKATLTEAKPDHWNVKCSCGWGAKGLASGHVALVMWVQNHRVPPTERRHPQVRTVPYSR